MFAWRKKGYGRAACLMLLVGAAQGWALESLPDTALADTTGQEGIAVQLELRINTDSNGVPITSPSSIVANPGDFANCGSLTNFSSVGCRLAINLAGRTDKWLVFKNYYGRIVFPSIWLDGGFTPASATSYADLNRFKDKDGQPLIATPNNIPFLKLSAPRDLEIWSMNIGGIVFEDGPTGYLNNSRTVPLGGIKIGNSINDGLVTPVAPGTISLKGTVGVFGF